MRRAATIVGVAWLASTGVLSAQSVTAGNITVRFTGRMQFQFNTTSVEEDEVGGATQLANSTFETRRVRPTVQLSIDDWITGIVEPDLALAKLQIRQAWMNLAIDPTFELKFGQFKKPFSQIFLTSSLETSAIERGQRIRGLYEYLVEQDEAAGGNPVISTFHDVPLIGEEHDLLDMQGYLAYELGVSAHGMLGAFDYDIGVFNGSGPDRRDENDGKSVAGRLRWRAPSELPIAIAASASYRETELFAPGPTIDGRAYMLDFEVGAFRRPGVHLIAEAVVGDNLAADETFQAGQAMLSLFRPVSNPRLDGIEPVARVSWGDPNREVDGDDGVLLTPGLNLYFEGKNRLMFNWDFFVPSGDRFETRHALRAQAQLAW